jgi:hypothetical protein
MVGQSRVRASLSICAATVGVLICLEQGHFRLSLAEPHSFVVMTTHRCGLVLLAAVAWMVAECCFAGFCRRVSSRREQTAICLRVESVKLRVES